MNVHVGHTVRLIRRAVETLSPQAPTRWDVPFRGLKGRPKIIILSDRMDATYYATFHYPLQYLQDRALLDFAVMSGAEVRKSVSRMGETHRLVDHLIAREAPHAVIFSRYATPYGHELLEAVRSHSITTLYYCDDNLLDLPANLGNGVLAAHADHEVVEQRRACLATADRILASTSYLAETLKRQFPNQQTQVLLYPPYLECLVRPAARRHDGTDIRTVTIGYMGSKGHQRDLEMAVPAIAETLERFPHTRFETFGTIAMPDALHRFARRVDAHGPKNRYPEFLQGLHDLHWDVGLAPLVDDCFNRCRSPIKFVEYTACHIATVASDVGVYRPAMAPGCGLVVQEQDWCSALEQFVTDAQLRRSCLEQAREACARQFSLQKVAAGFLAALGITQRHEAV
jgi:glycosyltransferase involved in cell wall biosynthesis